MKLPIEVDIKGCEVTNHMDIVWLNENTSSKRTKRRRSSDEYREADENISNRNKSDTKRKRVMIQITCFRTVEDCLDFAFGAGNRTILVILANDLSTERLSYLVKCPQIGSIYQRNSQRPWEKREASSSSIPVDVIITQIESTCNRIVDNETTLYPISERMINAPIEEIDNNSRTIIIYQLLIEVIIRSPRTEQSKKDFLDYARKMFIENNHFVQDIEKFDSSYKMDEAIYWYTRPSFVHRIISMACSVSNMQQIFKVRYFLCDLYNDLKLVHSTSRELYDKILQVYHGKRMAEEEVRKLDKSLGEVIITTTFLSATIDRKVALFFAGEGSHSDAKVAVIFRIFIDTDANETKPTDANETKPFAFIGSRNPMSDELEVLISVGTIFKILLVQEISEGLWEVTLKRDIKEQTLEQTLIDHTLTTDVKKQEEIICSMLDLLQSMQGTESFDAFIQLMFNHRCSLSFPATNEIAKVNKDEQSKLQMRRRSSEE